MKMIKLSMIIIIGFVISGCASSGDDMSKNETTELHPTQTANLKCNAGEIMSLQGKRFSSVSDGRYGRKGKEIKNVPYTNRSRFVWNGDGCDWG